MDGWIIIRDVDRDYDGGGAVAGGPIDKFCEDNADSPEVCEAVRALKCGESVDFGGGAAPHYRVVRTG